jgi:hypothetical protein
VLVAELGGRPEWEVRLITRQPERWSGTVTCVEHGAASEAYPLLLGRRPARHEGRAAAFAWSDAREALDGADLVLLVCPVHAHRPILASLLPALDPDRPVAVGSLFAQGGFDWVTRDVLASLGITLPRATFFGLKRYPYLCRKIAHGREVVLDGRFPRIAAAMDAPSPEAADETAAALEAAFHKPVLRLPSFLSCTLNMSNQILHMGLVVGHLAGYAPGRVYAAQPRLYADAPLPGARAMEALFCDLLRLCVDLERLTGLELRRYLGLDPTVGHALRARLALGVDLERTPRLQEALTRIGAAILRNNRRLRHVKMPMTPAPDGRGFVPDRSSRFWEDDITHGLCVLLGMGRILGTELSTIPRVIETYQDLTGRRLLVAGEPGPDFETSGAPQRYGVHDRAALRELLTAPLRRAEGRMIATRDLSQRAG